MPSGDTCATSPLSIVPPSALNRSAAGTPGRRSSKGLKLCVTGAAWASTTLFSRVPATSNSPKDGFVQWIAVLGLRIAADFRRTPVTSRRGQAAVVQPIRGGVVNDGAVAAERPFPRLVKSDHDAFIARRVQHEPHVAQRVDEEVIGEQLASRIRCRSHPPDRQPPLVRQAAQQQDQARQATL